MCISTLGDCIGRAITDLRKFFLKRIDQPLAAQATQADQITIQSR